MQTIYSFPAEHISLHCNGTLLTYHNNPKYWDRQACINSVDPDQMLQNAVSDQGPHWLPLIQHFFRHINR